MAVPNTDPFTYPGQLEPIRAEVLKAIMHDPDESRKLGSCRYKSRCRSIYCPLCCRQSGYELKGRILEAASLVDRARLRFATFTAKDVPFDSLREAGSEIMRAGRGMLKTLKVAGYAARLETSFEEWGDSYHAHLHAIVDTPAGGRGFIPGDAWIEGWLRELPTSLHPVQGGAHVTPVRNLEASATYLTKSPFFDHVAESTARTVAAIRECRGMQRSAMKGTLSPT